MRQKSILSLAALFALMISHLIWGANFVIAKITLAEIPQMTLAFARFALAILLLLPFVIIEHRRLNSKIRFYDLPLLVVTGLLMITFTISLFYSGIIRTTATNASALTLTVPLLSVLSGWWIFREKVYWINLLGVLLGLGGTFLILGLPLIVIEQDWPDHLFGDLLIILSSICFVLGSIFSKKMLQHYSSLTLTIISFAVGATTFLPSAVLEYLENPFWISRISLIGVLGLIYITVLSTISAFFLYEWGLEKIDLAKANLFQYLEPAVAATLAVSLLQERISFSYILGTVMIFLGLYWGTLGKLEHHQHFKHHR